MEEWNPIEDEIDWLIGAYTYRREKLRRAYGTSKALIFNEDPRQKEKPL
jgi:hypothetical protein